MRPSSFHGWRATGLLLAGLSLAFGTAAYAGSAATPEATAAGKRMAANYGKIPLSFEANQGQTDPSVQFLSRCSGYSLFLTQGEVVLNLERQQAATPAQGETPAAAPAVAQSFAVKAALRSPTPNRGAHCALPGGIQVWVSQFVLAPGLNLIRMIEQRICPRLSFGKQTASSLRRNLGAPATWPISPSLAQPA